MFNSYRSNGTCLAQLSPLSDGKVLTIPGAPVGKPLLPIVIGASVGLNGANKTKDVEAIQKALNFVAPEDGGPTIPLKIDGISGPKTRSAIRTFQLRQFGPAIADQLVEPQKRTIKALNTVLRKAFVPLTLDDVARAMGLSPAQVRGFLNSAFLLARQWLLEANIRLLLFGPSKVDPLAQKYFAIRSQPLAYPHVRAQVERMKVFADRPNIEDSFQPEPLIRFTETFAWCEAGGFDAKPDEIVFVPMPDGLNHPVKRNVVYYTARFVLVASLEGMAYTIVHELAHFCSRQPPVTDHSYQHRDPVGFERLPPIRKVTNADTFAMFVYEAGTGKKKSPMAP